MYVSLLCLPLAIPAYYVIAPAECSANLQRMDGVRFGHRCDNPEDLNDRGTQLPLYRHDEVIEVL